MILFFLLLLLVKASASIFSGAAEPPDVFHFYEMHRPLLRQPALMTHF